MHDLKWRGGETPWGAAGGGGGVGGGGGGGGREGGSRTWGGPWGGGGGGGGGCGKLNLAYKPPCRNQPHTRHFTKVPRPPTWFRCCSRNGLIIRCLRDTM